MEITWMTRQEAAKHLRVSPDTLDRMADAGLVQRYRIAGKARWVRFKKEELDHVLDNPEAPARFHVRPEGSEHEAGVGRAYTSWAAMKDRCSNPNSPSWKHYGGRGITVHPSWVN